MQILERLTNLKNKNVLIFAHDDPDGITSAIILTRLVKDRGGFPSFMTSQYFEYEPEKIIEAKKKMPVDVLIVVDKGTLKEYDRYLDFVDEVLIIDHHIPIGIPEKAIWFNPSIPSHEICSASGVVYMLKKEVCGVDEVDRFEALIGLKADWAINPVTGFKGGDISRNIYNECEPEFKNLFTLKSQRPTMFEVESRQHTCLMNQIAELYFAVTGGGFQYFYKDRGIDIYQPEFFYNERMQANNFGLNRIGSIEEFISIHKNAELIKRIYKFFLDDWNKTFDEFKNSRCVYENSTYSIYFFEGKFVKLMPMIGSVWAYEFKKLNNKEVVMIMLDDRDGSLHFSFRATKPVINLGVIAHELAERFIEIKKGEGVENPAKEISGGGHPVAAECRTRNIKFNRDLAVNELKSILGLKCLQ